MDAGDGRAELSGELPTELPAERLALVDLLDRLLAGGIVITGDITLSVADVDLVTISLRALLASVSALEPAGLSPTGSGESDEW
ncbi:MAG TPA: gas vesicle protein [Trebonia sp.]|nr:gas vesicle protein [Trebonia sp.]